MLGPFAAAALFLVCVLSGAALKEVFALETRETAALVNDLNAVQTWVRLERITAPELVKRLSDDAGASALWKNARKKLERGEALHTALTAAADELIIPKNAKAELKRCFCAFGNSDAETELKRLGGTIERLEAIEAELAAENARKTKLVSALSVPIGLALALAAL